MYHMEKFRTIMFTKLSENVHFFVSHPLKKENDSFIIVGCEMTGEEKIYMERGPIRAAIMSDTHGVLRPEVERILETCDVIVHAGDFDTQMLYHKLDVNQPLFAVRGNNDRGWSGGLPGLKRFEIGGVKFIMAHERTQIPGNPGDARVVVFGHSHMYQQQEINGRLWLNPGSCGYKRGTLPLSMAVMTIENGAYTLETIWLEKGYGTPEDAIEKREKTKKNRYERQQKRHMQEKKDKEMLFLTAKILRLYQADASRAWVIKNTGNDPELTAKIYDLCGTEETADAHRILAKLRGGI